MVIDDHLLLRVLLGDEPTELRPRGAVLATTGLWYHRLCRALADPTVTGSMSRALGNVDDAVAHGAVSATIELPDSIELLSLRKLGWPMARIVATGIRLNLLSLEALAAAELLRAPLCLADVDRNAPLLEAADRRGVPCRLLV